MADFNFRISPNVVLGSYSASRLGQFVREWGSRYMVILDPVLNEYDVATKIKQSLTDRKVDYFVFDEIPTAPDTSVVQQALQLAREAHIHGVITAGGTKAANVGRAVAALYNEVQDIYEFVDGAAPVSGALPLISIPTSMRDMFIFADRTPIIDGRNRQLKLLKMQPNVCKLALFDPNLSISLTENQIASLTLHTLCMAIECYISQKASFFSDTIAEKAIELLGSGMDGAPNLTSATTPEMFIAQGGCMTSLAAGVSSTGVASLLALTINARFKLSRSIVAAILFPYAIEEAAKYKTEKLAKVARILRVTSETSTSEVAVDALISNIRDRLAMANLPTRLKDLSVSVEQLSLAAEDAGQLDLINNLPRSMTADDLFDIIKQAY